MTKMKKAAIDEILEPVDETTSDRRERKVRAGFWRTLKRAARQIPFVEDVVAAYFCAMDVQTPTRVRGILLAALAYFVLPIDLIPDFIAGFGYTDDVAVLTAAIGAVRNHMTPAHYAAAKAALSGTE